MYVCSQEIKLDLREIEIYDKKFRNWKKPWKYIWIDK